MLSCRSKWWDNLMCVSLLWVCLSNFFRKLIVTCLLGVTDVREYLYWYPIIWCSHYNWNSCWVLVLCLPRIYIDFTEIIFTQWRPWTCYACTQSFDVVTTTHMESGWDVGVLFVCLFITSNNFLCGRRFSRLAKVFGWKDCCCPYH